MYIAESWWMLFPISQATDESTFAFFPPRCLRDFQNLSCFSLWTNLTINLSFLPLVSDNQWVIEMSCLSIVTPMSWPVSCVRFAGESKGNIGIDLKFQGSLFPSTVGSSLWLLRHCRLSCHYSSQENKQNLSHLKSYRLSFQKCLARHSEWQLSCRNSILKKCRWKLRLAAILSLRVNSKKMKTYQ